MGDIRSVLFVCLGNICRSPLAEAVFISVAKEQGVADKWITDSAGTGAWHNGEKPDVRVSDILKVHNITGYSHLGRQFVKEDFHKFDYIFGMDQYNIRDINALKPEEPSKAKVYLFGTFDQIGSDSIQDPYYNTKLKSFENIYQKCRRTCINILKKIKKL